MTTNNYTDTDGTYGATMTGKHKKHVEELFNEVVRENPNLERHEAVELLVDEIQRPGNEAYQVSAFYYTGYNLWNNMVSRRNRAEARKNRKHKEEEFNRAGAKSKKDSKAKGEELRHRMFLNHILPNHKKVRNTSRDEGIQLLPTLEVDNILLRHLCEKMPENDLIGNYWSDEAVDKEHAKLLKKFKKDTR